MKSNNSQYNENLDEIANSILSGQFSFRDYYGVTDDATKVIYSIGYQMYVNKKYDKAHSIFSLLCILDPTADNFYAQAAASFMLQNYAMALSLYHMAMVYGKNTPSLFEQMAKCCAYLNKMDLLKEYASESIRLSKLSKFKNIKSEKQAAERSKLMLNRLNEYLEKNAEIAKNKVNK